ncbi:MAG: alpha/beta hydrolase-fold protein [Desulfobacterales bacterium]
MNLKSGDDIQTCCETTKNGAQSETKILPVFSPVKNPDLIGTLHHFSSVPSQFVIARNVEVWLPPDYDEGDASGYSVLYMHDGQNLFESQKSYIGVDWGLDETMAALCQKRKIRPTIVVGVWNTPQRLLEYLPQRPFCDHRSQHLRNRVIMRYRGMPISDNYLRFLVYELKPFVDSRYRTRPEREFTFLMGSSMGGLISLYAICEYPHVFGGAGCLSTHWPIALQPFSTYLNARLPEPGRHKIYLDYGNEADNAGYRYKQKRVEHLLMGKGYKFGLDWFGSWYVGDPHSETAWRDRVHVPLRFLLKNDQKRLETTT